MPTNSGRFYGPAFGFLFLYIFLFCRFFLFFLFFFCFCRFFIILNVIFCNPTKTSLESQKNTLKLIYIFLSFFIFQFVVLFFVILFFYFAKLKEQIFAKMKLLNSCLTTQVYWTFNLLQHRKHYTIHTHTHTHKHTHRTIINWTREKKRNKTQKIMKLIKKKSIFKT